MLVLTSRAWLSCQMDWCKVDLLEAGLLARVSGDTDGFEGELDVVFRWL